MHDQATQQSVVATSSAGAEHYGIGAGLLELIGLQTALKQIGIKHGSVVRCDSSSGRALASRVGFGRTKHVDVKKAWNQETLVKRKIRLVEVTTLLNLADIGTKSFGRDRLIELATKVGLMDRDLHVRTFCYKDWRRIAIVRISFAC